LKKYWLLQIAKLFMKCIPPKNYTADHLVIATGFYDIPYLLNVPGENLPKVRHYYKDPNFYAFQDVLVVGSQNSAVDAALETWRKGRPGNNGGARAGDRPAGEILGKAGH
jgi:thioredoxin reductase (NADPH)